MNRTVLLCTFFALVAVAFADDTYTTKWDNINVDEILGNERLKEVHKKCLLSDDEKGCPEETKTLKSILPEALETGCAKCTEKQKAGAEKIIKWIIEHDSEGWKKLKAKWDPTGEYTKKYEEEAKKHGINP